ncbi:MAG: FKBP-type peptidyl-prolyl cis-trans isomerase [Candidatus Aenigmatarchaeota archaeon]
MKTGDFIYIDYVGRVKDTGEIFDLTIEEVARKEGVFNPNIKYKPVPIVVDAGFVIKGLDEALKEMKVGEKKTIEIPPEKAFGERDENLIRLIPLSLFKEKNIDSTPGSYVMINNIRGRIISNDGGRVKVDFNHPLAGKKLQYDVEIKKEIIDISEKIKAIIYYFSGIEFDEILVEIKGKIVEIKFDKKISLNLNLESKIADEIKKWIKDVEKVRFVSEY